MVALHTPHFMMHDAVSLSPATCMYAKSALVTEARHVFVDSSADMLLHIHGSYNMSSTVYAIWHACSLESLKCCEWSVQVHSAFALLVPGSHLYKDFNLHVHAQCC